MFVFLSLCVQQVLGYSAIKAAGQAFLVIATGMVASSGLAQHLVTRLGVKAVLSAGLLGLAAAQVLFLPAAAAGGCAAYLLPGARAGTGARLIRRPERPDPMRPNAAGHTASCAPDRSDPKGVRWLSRQSAGRLCRAWRWPVPAALRRPRPAI